MAKTLDSEFIVREASEAVREKGGPLHGRWFACLRRPDGSGSDHYLHRDAVVRVGTWNGSDPMGYFTAEMVVECAYHRWVKKGRQVQCAELFRNNS